jgi:phosphoenolpyruvate carboxykinase (GTP)
VDEDGNFIWPGFGENIRVLKWIIQRVNNRIGARQTPIGLVPHTKDLNLEGLSIPPAKIDKLLEIDRRGWQAEMDDVKKFFSQFGDRMPAEIREQCKSLTDQLSV